VLTEEDKKEIYNKLLEIKTRLEKSYPDRAKLLVLDQKSF